VHTVTIEYQEFQVPENITEVVECNFEFSTPVPPVIYDNCSNILTPSEPVIQSELGTCSGFQSYTFTYTDCAGNTKDWVFTYQIEDTTPPVVECSPISINLRTNGIYILSQNNINNLVGSVTDNCTSEEDIEISVSPRSFSCIQSGEAVPVTITATDDCGNTTECQTTVTVNDNMAPQITCPEDIIVRLEEGASTAVVDFTAEASDNCEFTMNYSHDPGSEFSLGTTNVVVTATDMAGNSSECNFDIIVVDENAPVVICPDDITVSQNEGQCGAVVNFEASISDQSDVTIEYSHESGSLFPVGTTTVTVIVTDDSGNSAACSFTVSVTDDEAPFIACPEDILVVAETGECEASVIVPEITELGDNCEFTYTNNFNNTTDASDIYPVGVTDVVWTIADAAGNTVSCTMTVTVQAAPVAVDDEASTDEDVQVEIDILANDTDCTESIDSSSVTITNQPANGTVSVDAETGKVTYTPAIDFFGTDTFTYSVCNASELCDEATVAIHVNDAIINTTVAETDEFTMLQDTILEADVSVNDYDPEGDNQINFSVLVPPANGTFALFPDGIFEFTPYAGFIGEDYFVYEVCDDGTTVACDTATAYILVEEREVDTIPVEPPFQVAFRIPEGFSPNYDGYNDYFIIQHLYEAYPNSRPKLEVYNRWGTLLYEQEDYGDTDRWGTIDAWWDGSSNKKWTVGKEKLPHGTYFYILYLNDGSEPITGSVFLNR
jgi:gliding motility-associated-like protein